MQGSCYVHHIWPSLDFVVVGVSCTGMSFFFFFFFFLLISLVQTTDTIQQQINKFLHALIIEIQNVVVLWNYLLFTAADIWWSDHEQHTLLGCVLGPCLSETLDLGLLCWSADYSRRLYCDGTVHQLPHHIPTLDMFHRIPVIPIVSGDRLRSWLCFWLVIDSWY